MKRLLGFINNVFVLNKTHSAVTPRAPTKAYHSEVVERYEFNNLRVLDNQRQRHHRLERVFPSYKIVAMAPGTRLNLTAVLKKEV